MLALSSGSSGKLYQVDGNGVFSAIWGVLVDVVDKDHRIGTWEAGGFMLARIKFPSWVSLTTDLSAPLMNAPRTWKSSRFVSTNQRPGRTKVISGSLASDARSFQGHLLGKGKMALWPGIASGGRFIRRRNLSDQSLGRGPIPTSSCTQR